MGEKRSYLNVKSTRSNLESGLYTKSHLNSPSKWIFTMLSPLNRILEFHTPIAKDTEKKAPLIISLENR